ncbi:protein translocase subunit SecD [Actinocorallia sp. A-T 12471]|uniref:protein translocase subunit SecD n=1 Tax=Actinocorallia sp. A-T 12471 TaxID=3089813 RepID=UPI0029CDC6A5|nr:protein translocase subunit SecD [Actinocorallia sp. A-T 12471]MDX6740305.1 protein translocase subunit SecD [Actinocorallia sp. A-T 12471]
MASNNRNVPSPVRTLVAFFAILAVLTGVMFLQGSPVPKLGLDLAGGTTITMTAQTEDGKAAPAEQMDQAVKIIRDRVNGNGLTDAEVTKQGDNVIVVSVPGDRDDQAQIIELVGTTAQLQFRQVLVSGLGASTATPSEEQPAAEPSGESSPEPTGSPTTSPTATPSASPTEKDRALSSGLVAAAPTPTPTASGAADPTPTGTPSAPATEEPLPVDSGEDFSNVKDEKVIALYKSTVCTPNGPKIPGSDDPKAQYVVACEEDGSYKYILGPVAVPGTEVKEANVSAPNAQAGQTGWEVVLTFKKAGTAAFGELTKKANEAYLANPMAPEAQIAIVLDGQVVSAPQISNGAILGGTASISGGADFTQAYSENLSQVLKYGALPLQFPEDKQTISQISSSLGADQLRGGLIAGAIGLGLVLLYCLWYYRALGLVAMASLVVATAVTYVLVVIFGENAGFRVSLPHIIGLIVSIGITADSFIVYFERLRDELRLGRPLRPSVEVAWKRARRTIIVADAVTMMAGVVLYFLAVGGVRGFAFAMALTTLIDLIVVFFFTKPLVALLARMNFFSKGHKWSGLDTSELHKPTPTAFRAAKRLEA